MITMSLKGKYIRNSYFNVVGWIWLVALNLATVPYIVHKLGYDAYGILALVLLVLGYFSFLDFGLGDAVIKYFSHYYTLKDFDKLNKIINSILFLYLLIGLFGAGLIILFTKLFALKIFKIPLPLHPVATYCFYLGAVGFVLNLIFGVISKIPEAIQRFDLSNRNNVIMGTTITLSSVFFLFLGYGLREVIIVNLLGSLLGIVLFYRTTKKLVPQLIFNMKFHSRDFKEIVIFGLYTVYIKLSSLITGSVNQFFVGALVGTSGVTIFNVPFKIILRFQSLIYRISFIVFPLSSELSAAKDNEKIRSVYLQLSKYILILSSFFFIPLISFSREILRYWMGPDFAARSSYVMLMCCLFYYMMSLTMVPGLVALGLGQPKYTALFSSLTALINIALVIPLIKSWGIDGAATALFLSSITAPVMIYVISVKVVRITINEYLNIVIGRSVFVILLSIIIAHNLKQYMTNIWYFLCIIVSVYLLLAASFYEICLRREEKMTIRNNVIILIKRLGVKKA